VRSGLKRFVLWDYPRASWQFDVMVGVILMFVFLTPRSWFRDQPRTPHANQVAVLGAGHGDNVFWLEPELLTGVPDDQRLATLTKLLKSRTGKTLTIARVEPILDSEGEIKGYMAFAKR
jgi:hypothetical protein